MKDPNIQEELNVHIEEYKSDGCTDVSRGMGFCRMPPGYALVLNSDRDHYFWVRWDGEQGEMHCRRRDAFNSAKKDSVLDGGVYEKYLVAN